MPGLFVACVVDLCAARGLDRAPSVGAGLGTTLSRACLTPCFYDGTPSKRRNRSRSPPRGHPERAEIYAAELAALIGKQGQWQARKAKGDA